MNIICFSNIDWDFLRQRHQNIMEEFSKRGDIEKIIFVETIGTRNIKLNREDLLRIKKKINSVLKRKGENKSKNLELRGNSKIKIISPKFIPFFNRISFKLNEALLKIQLDSIIKENNIDLEKTVAWTILQHPSIEKLLRKYPFKKKVFDCIDDVKSIPNIKEIIINTEQKLIKESDLVFATSKKLFDYCIEMNNNTHMLKNAVNSDFLLEEIINKDYYNNSKKVIGYVGTIYEWFDIEKIIYLAKHREDLDIILAGPIRINIDILKNFKNIKILGKVSHEKVREIIKFSDVCIIPFILNDLILNTNPVKIYEYFSMGKPVVSSRIPELFEFKDCIYLYKDDEDFLKCINDALIEVEKIDFFKTKKRIEIAKNNTWENRVDKALKLLKE